jgi:Putative metallopeptidase
MLRNIRTSLLLAALCAAGMAAIAIAQSPTTPPQPTPSGAPRDVLNNSKIVISYDPVTNYLYQGVADRLKSRHVLEELRRFLAPLRLPTALSIKTTQCGETNSWYEPHGGGVFICYEFVDWMERLAPTQNLPSGVTPQDAIVGPFVMVVFHELGHAVFDLLQVPIMGKEEDAADQFSGYIMLLLGKDVARQTIPASAYFWQAGSTDWSHIDFADVHGNPIQRSYNYLCMAYGGYPDDFKDLVANGLLPQSRADLCPHDYQVLQNAFNKTIMPSIDQDLLKVVQSRRWLRPNDGTIRQ